MLTFSKIELLSETFAEEDVLEADLGSDAPKFYDGWIEDNVMHLTFRDNNDFDYDYETKIDMRKIKKPRDLQKYIPQFAKAFEDQYVEYQSYL